MLQHLLEVFDVVDGGAQNLHLRHPLIRVGAGAAFQGLEGLIHFA